MIKNKQKTPIIIDKLAALIKRIPSDSPKRHLIVEYLTKQKAGFKGEQSLTYFYRYLPQNEITILKNIRILYQEFYFQIDSLILTPYFFIILEIKNIYGHIYFDDLYSQIIRVNDGKKESFDNPIQQVERQAYHLSEILKLNKIPFIPIETLVIITNPKTLIESALSHKEAPKKVIKSSDLKIRYERFKQKHSDEILMKKDIKKVIKLISNLNTPYEPDVCSLFKIETKQLLKGVFCTSCDDRLLIRRKRSWYCPICNGTHKNAYISALRDFALLISTDITNIECKEFLNLKSSSQSYHILKSLQLPYTGSTKSRTYKLDKLLE